MPQFTDLLNGPSPQRPVHELSSRSRGIKINAMRRPGGDRAQCTLQSWQWAGSWSIIPIFIIIIIVFINNSVHPVPCRMLVLTAIAFLTASLVRSAATHTIVVGANGNTFNATSITTNPGDVITFSLYVALFPSILKRTDRSRYSQGANHTPTQSTFFSLCTALQGGESSGPCVFQVPSHRSLIDHLLVCPPLLPHRV